MKTLRIKNKLIVRIDKGEELIETLTNICKQENIKLGSITGIGAANKVKIGLFDVEKKEYFSQEFNENFEISSLIGNISTMNNEVYLHLHINVANSSQQTFGGHLNLCIISATFEGIIDIIDGEIDRKFSEDVGLNLFEF